VSDPSTTRQVRKTAEKAALDALAGDMVAVIGDLAVATTNISSANDVVATAQRKAEELIADATRQGDALVAAAAKAATAAIDTYATTWTTAKSGSPDTSVGGF